MPTRPPSPAHPTTTHYPFAHAKGQIIVIPPSAEDFIEDEIRSYDEIVNSGDGTPAPRNVNAPSGSPTPTRRTLSVFSNDIWLADNSGESHAFARDVKIIGWTSVGDKRGGAYVVYDCKITLKEGAVIHALKRFSEFEQLHTALMFSLPRTSHHDIPKLPPKAALAKYRAAFLDRRRQSLQQWLSAVLLHPDIGGCQAVRTWVMD